jgi:hypothetical protein
MGCSALLHIAEVNKYGMMERKLCPCCRVKPVAVAYHKYGRIYYRSRCWICYKKKRKPLPPGWLKSGYTKKEKCEKCGFKFRHAEQAHVFHLDGNENNNNWVNLKTICANCAVAVKHSNLPWKASGLTADF